MKIPDEISVYNKNLSSEDQVICDFLAEKITEFLPEAESKILHAHPVLFLD